MLKFTPIFALVKITTNLLKKKKKQNRLSSIIMNVYAGISAWQFLYIYM